MNRDINIKLKETRKLYDSKKYVESLNSYEELFNDYSEQFKRSDLISYCWAIYQTRVKNFSDENELFEAVELITTLVPQADLNYKRTCPYTFSVFALLDYLFEEKNYFDMSCWIDKLNPDLLNSKRGTYNGRYTRSRKEKYFDYATKAYLECGEWESCIEAAKNALDSMKVFTNGSDAWYNWRIAKSLRELDKNAEAIAYLEEVAKVKNDWFIYREFAENYHILNDNDNALKYISKAILAKGSINMKVNLFCLAFRLLKNTNDEMALSHAELCYLLKCESNTQIPEELEELMIDEESLDKNSLITQINEYWSNFQFQSQDLQYGTVTKFVEERNFGFIVNDDNESIFFHGSDFRGEDIYVGQLVSFYTEENFDKSKNRKSLKAVNIRGE